MKKNPNHPVESKLQDKAAVVQHFHIYVAGYTSRNVTLQAATVNYVREFPNRIHTLILALLDKL